MSLGPVMLDLEGTVLQPGEREMLQHPLVGGVILFTRNYESPEQLMELVEQIHQVRSPRLLVCVDHEGGRVQRFREGFTRLPPARIFGRIYDEDRRRGRHLAETAGWLMAAELRAVGIDFSFAPVLDIDKGVSEVIGDRAYHSNPQAVSELALAYVHGMGQAGMAATGKHFPGHGGVEADSHVAIPVDDRTEADLSVDDLVPFDRLIRNGLAGIMPAHVIYPAVDEQPAGFSPYWLQDVLRSRLGFKGLIFSDDLSMEGATVAGGYVERAEAAFAAGCDVVLVCNNRKGAEALLDGLRVEPDPILHSRLARMHGRGGLPWNRLHLDKSWQQARQAMENLTREPLPELDL
jgi:beta-N-acetylhexosaminidase